MLIGALILVIVVILIARAIVFQKTTLTIDGVRVKVRKNRFSHKMNMKIGSDKFQSQFDWIVGINAKRGTDIRERKGM